MTMADSRSNPVKINETKNIAVNEMLAEKNASLQIVRYCS